MGCCQRKSAQEAEEEVRGKKASGNRRRSRRAGKRRGIEGAVLAFMVVVAVPAIILQLREWGLSGLPFRTSFISEWGFRKSHEIFGSSAGEVSDYQIRIVVHYGSGVDGGEHVYLSGKCRTDFGDVRFADSDGVTELPYWIEEMVDGDYAVFWVKVPYIPAYPNSKTIYIYYGKSDAATTSNGYDTFLLFDDFSSNGSNNWESWSSGFTIEDGVLKVSPVSYGAGAFAGDENWVNIAVRARVKHVSAEAWPFGAFASLAFRYYYVSEYSDYFYALAIYPNDDKLKFILRNYWSGIDVISELNYTLSSGIYYTLEVRMNGDSITGYINGEQILTMTDTAKHRGKVGFFGCGYCEFDDIFVRKYIEPEPTHGSWSNEELVDLTPPSISSFTIDPDTPEIGETITFTVHAADDRLLDRVTLNITTQYSSLDQTVNSVAMSHVEDDCYMYQLIFNTACNVTATAIAVDSANNMATKTITFQVTPPVTVIDRTETRTETKVVYEVPHGDPIFDILISSTRNVWFWLNDEIVTVRFINKRTCWDEVQVELWLADTSGSPRCCLLKDTFQVGTGTTQVIVPVHVPLMPGDFRLLLKVHEEYSGEEYQLLGTQVLSIIPLPETASYMLAFAIPLLALIAKWKAGRRRRK